VIAASFSTADLWMLVAILVLLIVLAMLAVAEMGLSRISPTRAAIIAQRGTKSAKALTRLVEKPELWVNSLLLSVNVCQTLQATLTGIVAGRMFGAAGVAIGVVLNVIVFFVLAESVPKTYAVIWPEKAALVTARPVSALITFYPLRLISNGLIKLTNVIVKGKGLEKGPFVSEQELLGIVEAAADDEVIEHEERELIESIIEFGDTVVREVMRPRPDMVVIEPDMTVTAALDRAIEHGISRLPVIGTDEHDDAVGLVYTKDLMRAEREGRGHELATSVGRAVVIVPENKPVARLMREMQAQKFHLAIVADEYGNIVGLCTLEDCLEELVGEIVDEFDEETAEVVELPDGTFRVDGRANVSDLNDRLGVELPDEEWDTVAGFVFGTLEHVPLPGEEVDYNGWRFVVERVEGRRIRSVLVHHEVEPA
jgi:CBS domain containing-hemolysin-like protein